MTAVVAGVAGGSALACGAGHSSANNADSARPAPRAPAAPIAPFTPETYARRRARAAALARGAGASALLVTSGTTNFAYLTGRRVERSERLIALMIPVGDAPAFVVAPSFEVKRLRGALAVSRFIPWDEHEGPYEPLRRALTSTDASPTILIEAHTEHGTASALERACPEAKVRDGSAALDLLRARKEGDELARIRRAIAITERVFEAAFERLAVGVRDTDLARMIGTEFERAGVEGYALVQFGPLSAQPHGSPRGDALTAQCVVLIDGGCQVDGYWSDITRTRWFGDGVSDEFRKVHDLVHAAQTAALSAARPGVAAQEIDRAARAVISKAGYGDYFTHRVGHGLGMDGHEPVYLVEGNERPLEDGFVFTIEPGVYLPGRFGVRIEDDVLCTSVGAQLLSRRTPLLS